MKKTFLLMKLLVLCVCAMSSAGAWATGEVFYVKFQNSSNVTQSTANYFTYDKGAGNAVSWSSKGKHSCTYGGDTYSDVIKMEGSTQCYFTSEAEATITIVQTISNATGDKLKFDGTDLTSSMANTTITVNTTDKYNEYVITKVAAGTHTITRQSETGLAYVKVEYTGEAVAIVANPIIAWNSSTSQATITCATAGATIYYTTDGSVPTTSSNTYSSAISLDNSCSIRAFAKKDDVVSDFVTRDCYVTHASALATLRFNGGTLNGDANVWTSTDGNFTLTDNTESRTIQYTNVAGSKDGFKLNANDNYTLQPSEGIKVTKLVVVGKTWLPGEVGNASTIAFDGFTPASGSFYDYPTDGETYVKTIEFTLSTEQTYGQAITMSPSVNQLGAYIEVYGDIKTYTVNYDAGANGTGSIAAGEKSYGSAFTLSSSKFTRDGYVQTGWATSDGGPQVYALGGTYTANADITLYPVWSVIVEKVTASWDFTNWSEATKTGVKANSEWSQNEKSDKAGALGDGDKGYSNIEALSNSTITYGGTNIPETVDLEFSANAYGVGLIFNLPSTDIGTYLGSQYIWLYSASSIITIPSVPANATIEIGVESHKDSEARGVTLKNGSTILTQTQGEATAKAYQVCKWTNTSSAGDITITPTAGLHIYYITVTENKENIPVSTATGRNFATCVTTKQLNFSAATGITAYIATGLNSAKDAVVLEEVSVVPAGTPIIVKTKDKGQTVNVPVTTATADDVSENKLVAGDGTTAWDGTDGFTYYYIASDQFHKATSGTLQSGKAYLKMATSAIAARQLGIVFGDSETTGIGATLVNNGIVNNEFFNLQGQRVAQPTKGLYIVNGKKVIMK